jgi:hypothetical protein
MGGFSVRDFSQTTQGILTVPQEISYFSTSCKDHLQKAGVHEVDLRTYILHTSWLKPISTVHGTFRVYDGFRTH